MFFEVLLEHLHLLGGLIHQWNPGRGSY
jgi:hypothetical protein